MGFVWSSWHAPLVENLQEGAQQAIDDVLAGADRQLLPRLTSIQVSGCYEIPFGCKSLIMGAKGPLDALVALGVIIRGETIHFDLVASAAAQGVQEVQLETAVPIGFGVLAVETREQAEERAQVGDNIRTHNAGYDAMLAALRMYGLKETGE